jgi:uncharacterized RDD family membrane protein YckC
MAATVACPECRHQMRVAESKLCLGIRCPYCHDAFMDTLAVDEPMEQPTFGGARRKGPASRLSRLGAYVIDVVILGGCIGLGLFALSSGSTLGVILFLLAYLAAFAFALVDLVWLSKKGQTIGKRLAGIRIVNYFDGRNPGFMGAVVMRNIVPSIIPGMFLIDYFFIFGEERRCLHDLIAGTRVVEL